MLNCLIVKIKRCFWGPGGGGSAGAGLVEAQPYEQGRSTEYPEAPQDSSQSCRNGSDHHPFGLTMM